MKIENMSLDVLGKVASSFLFKDKVTATDIYKKHQLTYSHVLGIMKALKKRNFIKGERGTENRRYVYYYMTEEGKKLFKSLYEAYITIKKSNENIASQKEQ
ncbi:MAG: winged helix DNA-binding protein [Candidatus Aenigmatarchaeota archaeon]